MYFKSNFSSVLVTKYLNVTPPMYVPKNNAVRRTLAAGSVAKDGKSCIYVAIHVSMAAIPTKLNKCH